MDCFLTTDKAFINDYNLAEEKCANTFIWNNAFPVVEGSGNILVYDNVKCFLAMLHLLCTAGELSKFYKCKFQV